MGSVGKIAEQTVKALASIEDAALDGAHGHSHTLGYLAVAISCEMHSDGDEVVVGEAVDNVGYLLDGV